jgi:hypothetical protein
VGANGSIYAVRRDLYKYLPKDSISDLLEPMIIYGNGFDIVYEPNAIAVEDTPREVFSRKRRIILRSLGSIKYVGYLLNPSISDLYLLHLFPISIALVPSNFPFIMFFLQGYFILIPNFISYLFTTSCNVHV